jgi:very-short-patch-repair endonuclease
MQMSLFQVLGEISYYSDNPSVKFSIDGIEQFSPEKYQHCISLIRKLQTYDEIINNIDQFIWKGYLKDSSSIKDREEISGNFEELANTINEFCSRFQSIASSLKINIPKNLRDCFELNSVISIFKPSIFNHENQELIRRIISRYDSILRVIRPQYWRDRNEISLHYWSDVTLPFNEEKEKLALVEKIISESKDMDLLPNDNTSLTKIEVDSFQESSKRITVLYKFSLSLFKEREIPEGIRNFLDNEFETTAEWYRDMSTQTDLIPEWLNFCKAIEEAEDFGLGDFIDNILEKKISPLLWEFTFRRRFYILLEDAIFQSNKILREFRSSTQKSLLDQFRKLDKELIELASNDIRSNLYKNRPEQTWVKADSAETVILRKEINRLRPIKPLRILFEEIPNLLLDLKPCLMMSPLTVSQLIDPNTYKFDIAIFDEASQIPPEYAVGTIMRADQVVIAGDRYQLPPTRFFQTIDTDEFDEDDYDIEEYESVLNACDVIKIPNKMLLWHYRSEDESLITFSNYNFYDNRLLTFPTANGDDKSTGLEFIYVPDGIYRRGKGARDNPKEAEKVAELVFKHLQETPEHTIGIVAFSLSQRRAIEMQIDKLKLENPHLYPLFSYNREEEVFIKNLETVQGDERDVIFFSVGYGKDETGNMSMNFGPLNRQGGERRLNVAVTRARKSVKLVSSIQPEDIDLSRTQSDGARLLRSYLKTAKYGPSSVFEDETYDPNAEFGSAFEESVYEALTKKGIQLRKQVGVSNYRIDFGVVDSENPGRYLLGIECDGATYHSTPTARDRDRLRQELLEEKFGWRIHRIWSLDWVNNPIREIKKVLSAIEKSKEIGPRRPVKKN